MAVITNHTSRQEISNFHRVIRVPGKSGQYRAWPEIRQRAYAKKYTDCCRAGYAEYEKLCAGPVKLNTLRNALEPRSVEAMYQLGAFPWGMAVPSDAELQRFFFDDWPDQSKFQGQTPADRLFAGVPFASFVNQYRRFLLMAQQTARGNLGIVCTVLEDEGRMWTVFGVGGRGNTLYPVVAQIAARFGAVPLNVCNCERFFSQMGWLETRRTARMLPKNFVRAVSFFTTGPRPRLPCVFAPGSPRFQKLFSF
jgi:hypothetical protein